MNVGGLPVRIVSAVSGCGCTTLKVTPRVVGPRETAIVEAKVDPIERGEKLVAITLETDSPANPLISLSLRVVSSRPPPCLIEAWGDLTYREGRSREDVREVSVDTLEPAGGSGVPSLRSDLPFLAFGPSRIRERPFAEDAGLVARTYFFPVTFSAPPPAEAFAGRVFIDDPWDAHHVLAVNVQGEADLPARAIPARLILTVAGPEDREARARFLVRIRDPRPDAKVEVEPGADAPLVVTRTESSDPDAPPAFDVRWRTGLAIVEGSYELAVRAGPDPSHRIVVPVLVKKGGRP